MTKTGFPTLNPNGGPQFDVELPFRTANKTKPIYAKHIQDVARDKRVLAKLMMDTLEGTQVLSEDSMMCIGVINDVWQQTREKLLAKYTVTGIDPDGWLICTPKPGVPVNAAQVTKNMIPNAEGFLLRAQWGFDGDDGNKYQSGEAGDYICQNPEDPDDLWIVKRGMFESTYEFE